MGTQTDSRYAQQLDRGHGLLRFDAETEAEFRQYYCKFMSQYLRAAAMALVAVVCLALLINNTLATPPPEQRWLFNLYKAGFLLPSLLALSVLLPRRAFYERVPLLSAIVVAGALVAFSHLTLSYQSVGLAYPYASFLFLYAFLFLLSGFRFFQAVKVGVFVFAVQLLVTYLAAGSWATVAMEAYDAIAVCALVGAASYIQEHTTRTNFLQRQIAQFEVSHDSLTGLLNRRGFEDKLELAWQVCRREQQFISMLVLDLDHFKRFNDAFGHASGDQCLARVGRMLGRTAGHRPLDLCARTGGEEFVLVLVGTELDDATAIAERVIRRIETIPLQVGQQQTRTVTMSCGVVSVLPDAEIDPWDVLLLADRALYRAKSRGRNQVAAEVWSTEALYAPNETIVPNSANAADWSAAASG